MTVIDGRGGYQSFRACNSIRDQPAQLAVPWSSGGVLDARTDPQTGKVTGKLSFASGVELTVTGSITPATAEVPERVELTAEGQSSAYKLHGCVVVEGSSWPEPVIVGTVVAVRNDVDKQPDGTSGPFLLSSLPMQGFLR